jgi:hypothetical protein
MLVVAAANQSKGISFHVPNGTAETVDYRVIARPVAADALSYLERHLHAEAVELERESISLHAVRPGRPVRARSDVRIRISATATQLCQVMVKTPRVLREDQFTALEIVRVATDPTAGRGGPAALGVVIFGSKS